MIRAGGLGGRTTVVAVLSTILAVLPVFLLGSVAVLVRNELNFDEAALGLAVSLFYATTAATSMFCGRVADKLGARRSITLAAIASACSLGGIGVLTRSWGALAGFLILAGIANALAQPASNLALARGVRPTRMGIAFGVKQSAIPAAGLVAGLALPGIALTLGWRWAYIGAAIVAVVMAVLSPRAIAWGQLQHVAGDREDVARGPLIVLAVGCMFGSAAGIAMGAFLVQSSIESGFSASVSGLVLALGGVVGVITRLLAGWLADRREGGHLTVVAWMLVLGAGGFGLLAVSDGNLVLLVTGTMLCFGLAWGWPGLFFLAIVRLNPNTPAAASGMGQAGGGAGGVLGPLIFGMVVANTSYPIAWWGAGASALLSALLMVLGRRAIIRRRQAAAAHGGMLAAQGAERR